MAGVRLSDAERTRLADELRVHLVDGRLTLDEFEARVALVFAATTDEEAAQPFVDLPPIPPAAPTDTGRRGRHGEGHHPQPGWRPTAEVFRDPSSSRLMRVWVDAADGSRHYVPEG
jgi:hypothetical protein